MYYENGGGTIKDIKVSYATINQITMVREKTVKGV